MESRNIILPQESYTLISKMFRISKKLPDTFNIMIVMQTCFEEGMSYTEYMDACKKLNGKKVGTVDINDNMAIDMSITVMSNMRCGILYDLVWKEFESQLTPLPLSDNIKEMIDCELFGQQYQISVCAAN
jgi:hypothetical protein